MTDIAKLLNKKFFSGRDLGILEIVNMATVFGQQIRHEPVKPIVSAGQLQSWIDSLTDVRQSRIYNGYIMIHEWISLYYNISQTNYQQIQLRYQSLYTVLFQCTAALKVARQSDNAELLSFFSPYLPDALLTDKSSELAESQKELLASCYFLNGYNTALTMIADFFEIPEITVFSADIRPIESQLSILNTMKTAFISEVMQFDKNKLPTVSTLFPDLTISSLTPPKENTEKVREMFDDFSAFRDSNIADLLCFTERN